MAQIVTITNPLTGQPAQVDQLEHTAQEIDDGIGFESTDYSGCYYRTVDGVVEWFNPPMQLGVEYRTTERYKNKPVYVNMVNCGEFATGATKRVAHGITMDSVVRAFGVRSNGESIPMTYTSNGTSYERINFMVGTSNVFITSENTASTGTLVVQIYYTKATD